MFMPPEKDCDNVSVPQTRISKTKLAPDRVVIWFCHNCEKTEMTTAIKQCPECEHCRCMVCRVENERKLLKPLHFSDSSLNRSSVSTGLSPAEPALTQETPSISPESSMKAVPKTASQRQRRGLSLGSSSSSGTFRKPRPTPYSHTPITRRFSCPFHEENAHTYQPKTHKRYGPCAGPGFTEVRYLRDHLKKAHIIPKCDECGKSEMSPGPCHQSPKDTERFLTDSQLKPICDIVSSKKKGMDQETKWMKISAVIMSSARDPNDPCNNGENKKASWHSTPAIRDFMKHLSNLRSLSQFTLALTQNDPELLLQYTFALETDLAQARLKSSKAANHSFDMNDSTQNFLPSQTVTPRMLHKTCSQGTSNWGSTPPQGAYSGHPGSTAALSYSAKSQTDSSSQNLPPLLDPVRLPEKYPRQTVSPNPQLEQKSSDPFSIDDYLDPDSYLTEPSFLGTGPNGKNDSLQDGVEIYEVDGHQFRMGNSVTSQDITDYLYDELGNRMSENVG